MDVDDFPKISETIESNATLQNVANYTGEMEVSTVASGSNIHHGRGIHSVNSWTVETTATK